MSFEKVVTVDANNPPIWDKTLQNVIIGRFIERKDHIGSKDGSMAMLENADKTKQYAVWLSTVLENCFKDIVIGNVVRIKYLGLAKDKYFNFEVSIGEEEDLTEEMLSKEE